jgi:WD40 repeat protein
MTSGSLTTPTFGALGSGAAPRVTLSPDGRLLATGASDGAVEIWDIAAGQRLWKNEACGPGTEVLCAGVMPGLLTFSPDGTRLFFARFDGRRGSVVDITTGTTFPLPPDHFQDVMKANGSQVTYTTWDGHTRIVLFRQDGAVLVTFRDNDVLLDARDESQVLQGHTLPVTSGAFNADGKRLATASVDGTARVWDTSTAHLIFTSPVEPSDVAGVAFSPDGSSVTAVYSDGRIVVYPIALEDAIEIAQSRLTRGFTAEECRRYLHVPSCPPDRAS